MMVEHHDRASPITRSMLWGRDCGGENDYEEYGTIHRKYRGREGGSGEEER